MAEMNKVARKMRKKKTYLLKTLAFGSHNKPAKQEHFRRI